MLEFRELDRALPLDLLHADGCQPIFDWFVDAAWTAGKVRTDSYDGVVWTPPKWEWVDPLKDVQGEKLETISGFKTLSSILRERGLDPDEVFKEYADERAKLKELGLTFDTSSITAKQVDSATDCTGRAASARRRQPAARHPSRAFHLETTMKKIRLADGGRMDIPMQTRLAPVGTVDTKARTAELVWSRGARVQRYDWWNDETYFEELSMDPAHVRLGRMQSGAPLLDTHNRWRPLRRARRGRERDGGERRGPRHGALLRARRGEPIFNDVAAGIIRNVSVGYVVHKYEQSRTPDGVLVMRAVDWEPSEISLVPVGADAGAGVRVRAAAAAAHLPLRNLSTRRSPPPQERIPA
jgi:hypothetical protein